MKIKSILDAITDYKTTMKTTSEEVATDIKFDLLLNRKKTTDWVKSNKHIVIRTPEFEEASGEFYYIKADSVKYHVENPLEVIKSTDL